MATMFTCPRSIAPVKVTEQLKSGVTVTLSAVHINWSKLCARMQKCSTETRADVSRETLIFFFLILLLICFLACFLSCLSSFHSVFFRSLSVFVFYSFFLISVYLPFIFFFPFFNFVASFLVFLSLVLSFCLSFHYHSPTGVF